MHLVKKIDWSFPDGPAAEVGDRNGLATTRLIGRDDGATHTDLSVGRLAPGGRVPAHVHSFETALYVLSGSPVVSLGGRYHRLVEGDFALVPVGLAHSIANLGDGEARWLSVHTPQSLDEAGRRDTFGCPPPGEDEDRLLADATLLEASDPTSRLVGHYGGTPPQGEALAVAVAGPARGRAPAGMDSALLAYSGISVKMMVDPSLGADLLTMFMVDYEIGGAAQAHDHPFEEAYVFLSGQIEAELDGSHYVLSRGDVVFSGVGSTHGFYNTGSERVRWIETQAPQPPRRHAYRWSEPWRRLGSR